jgi:hypothetical protein
VPPSGQLHVLHPLRVCFNRNWFRDAGYGDAHGRPLNRARRGHVCSPAFPSADGTNVTGESSGASAPGVSFGAYEISTACLLSIHVSAALLSFASRMIFAALAIGLAAGGTFVGGRLRENLQ